MALNPRVRHLPTNNQQHPKFIQHINRPAQLTEQITNHPIIVSGRLSPDQLKQFDLNVSEDYFLVNQVSHNLMEKHVNKFKSNEIPIVRVGNIDLCIAFYVVPRSMLFSNLKEDVVFLREYGKDLGQEEACFKVLDEKRKNSEQDKNPEPASLYIYDSNTKTWIDKKLNFSELNLYESMEEKRIDLEKNTGNFYNSRGELIAQPIINEIQKKE